MKKNEYSYLDFDKSKRTFSVAEISKYEIIPITKNRLYKFLREWGYLKPNNQPTDGMIEKGLMTEKEKLIPSSRSAFAFAHVPLFTIEGVRYLISDYENRLLNNKINKDE
jgi:phage antirepressor YoqD-like protein